MAFKISEKHIAEFQMRGYTVFKGIVPESLLSDLRNATDVAREIARTELGPQAQRLQPVVDYDLDHQPFIDFAELYWRWWNVFRHLF